MTKGGKKMKSRRAGKGFEMGKNESSTVRMAGRFLFYTGSAVTVSFVQLSPLVMDARILAESDGFMEFRFNKVKAKAWLGNIFAASPSVTPGGANLAIGFSPNLLTTAPVGTIEAMTLQNADIGNGTYGAPYPRIHLNQKDLLAAAPVKWFRRGTAYDDTLEVQGVLYFASTDLFSARPLSVLVEYEIEMRAPADPALTAKASAEPPTPEQMAKQILELQYVLGVQNRFVPRLKPVPSVKELGNGETCEIGEAKEDYVDVCSGTPHKAVSEITALRAPPERPMHAVAFHQPPGPSAKSTPR